MSSISLTIARPSRIFTLIALCMLIAGCWHRQPRSLRYKPEWGYKKVKEGVELRVAPLTKSECIEFFGTDLLSQGYQPLHVYIQNDTDDTFMLSWQHVALPLASDKYIKSLAHYSPGYFAFITGVLSAIYFYPLIPLFVIPGALYMRNENKAVDEFIEEYSLKNQEVMTILPHTQVSQVVFVYGWDAEPTFDIGLINKDQRKYLKFTVEL